MEWWRWTLAAVAMLLVLALIALRFDTVRFEKVPAGGGRRPRSTTDVLRTISPLALALPVVVVAALAGPWWLGAAAVAIPALALLAMAAAS